MVGQVEELARTGSMNWSVGEQAAQQVRIVVADDQRLFRESMAGMLRMETAFVVAGVASNGLEAIEAARQLQPHVLLMDVKMPQNVTHRMMQLLGRQLPEKSTCTNSLTSREIETLKLIARGMIAKEIALALEISEKTVRNHISSIYRKLDIYDRSQIVIYAMKKGLVELHDMR